MNKKNACILHIIRSAFDEAISIDKSKYDDCDFINILEISLDHNITSLIYEGISKSGILIDDDLNKLFKQRVIFEYVKSENQIANYKKISYMLEENNIEYIPLKGITMKSIYPKPELRRMGDIDIYVDEKNIEKVKDIMSELQFTPCGRTDYDYKFKNCNDILIEIHTSLMSKQSEFYSYYENPWNLCVKEATSSKHTLTCEEAYIYLFIHFLKHYRGGGIGINHIVDLWLYRKKNPNMDEEYIKDRIQKFGAEVFYNHTLELIDYWFCDGKPNDITFEIENYIFQSGSYGTAQGHQAAAIYTKERIGCKKAKKRVFIEKIFLPKDKMEFKYPILKKKPYLMFFLRCHRLFKRIFFKKDKELGVIGTLNANKDANIDGYKKHLEKVGL